MSRAERIKIGDDGYWHRDILKETPRGVTRVKGWQDVVEWIRGNAEPVQDGRDESVADLVSISIAA